jgi:hypothetical protein
MLQKERLVMEKEFKKNLQKGRIYLKQGTWMVRYVTQKRVKGGSPKQLGSYNTVTVANYIPIREEDTLSLRDPYDQGKETCFELILANEIENGYKNQPPGTIGFVAETKSVWYAKLWSTSEMVQDLQHYLETTPQEQIDKDWKKVEEFDLVGPTVGEFLGESNLTPEEKAGELFYYFYNRLEHTFSDNYDKHSTDLCKMCALKVVEEVLKVALHYNDTQPEVDYFNEVKKSLEKIGS